MDNCLFCKIASKEINSEIIYENDKTLAFLDISPRAKGHTMIIPKVHAEGILDLEDGYLSEILLTVKVVMDKIRKALTPDAFTIGANIGRASGQEIDHFHFHVMPRWKNDGGHSLQSVVDKPSDEDIRVVADRIRQS